MTRPHLSFGLFLLATGALAAPILGCGSSDTEAFEEPDVAPWAKALGDDASTSQVQSIAVGASGNIAITGTFNGSINFGGGELAAPMEAALYVAKLSAGGEHVWSGRTGNSNDKPTAVALDRAGSAVVTGKFDGELDLGTGPMKGEDNLFLGRFGVSGEPLWSFSVGEDSATDVANDIAVSATDGSIYLTGRAGGDANFGVGPLASSQFQTLFVARLNRDGLATWTRGFGSDGFADGRRIAIDKDGNTIIAGEFNGALTLGGGTLGSFDSYGMYVAKFDGSGAHVWSKGFTTFNNIQLADVAVDPSGNVLLTGNFTGPVDFGGGTLEAVGNNDVFLVKFGSGGGHVFSERFGEPGSYPYARGVGADGEGNIYLAGSFDTSIDFGGGALVSMGTDDIFWAKFTSGGAMVESRSFGDSASQSLWAMAVDTWGNTVLAGTFYGSFDFGSGRIDAFDQQKLFLARFK